MTGSTDEGGTQVRRVLLVDDHQFVTDCLRPLLESQLDSVEVVGSAPDCARAIELADRFESALIVMDIDLPGMGSFEATAQIIKAHPDTRVMFLSAHRHDEYIEQALSVGARGYALKSDDIDSILEGIRRVLGGDVYYSPSVLERLKVGPDGDLSLDRPGCTRLSTLTDRERQVLILLARGESVKRIAAALGIAYKTVDKHKVSLMKKLDIHDRVELCRFAVREHIIEA